MKNHSQAPEPSYRDVTLRRDQWRPLNFNGVKIGSVSRVETSEDDDEVTRKREKSARLYKTSGGKFVMGVEVYNRTDQEYESRKAFKADSLKELVEKGKLSTVGLTDDMIAELFSDTEIAGSLVERVD
jgi:hypothetical protein